MINRQHWALGDDDGGGGGGGVTGRFSLYFMDFI